MLATGSVPAASFQKPMPSSTTMFAMKKYVGTENRRPDSRTPRRLPYAMPTTNMIEIASVYGASALNADPSAAVPAATETATVST
jgi:hypothetical protein